MYLFEKVEITVWFEKINLGKGGQHAPASYR